jgi:TRAP transporter TAXI family solute receptor
MNFRRNWVSMTLVALIAAVVIAGGLLFYYKPRSLTLAVAGPQSTDDAQLIVGLARGLVSESAPFRFRTTLVNSPAEASALLEAGSVDLAVVRNDQSLPKNGQAIAILHRNPIVIVTLAATGVTKLTDLVGKSIAAIGRNDLNRNLLGEILPYYNLKKDDVTVVAVPPTDVPEALISGKIAAVLIAGPITGRATTEVIGQLSRDHASELVFIPFDNAEAIAKRAPNFEAVEIGIGSFGGNPPRPESAFSTLQFTTFLLAGSAMHDRLAAEVARNIFYLRPGLALSFPAANRIEAPDTEKDAIVPVHPGAAAYFDGEEESMFDQVSEWFYLALFGGGVLASALASLRRLTVPSGGVRDEELFRKLRQIIERAKVADSEEELIASELELNEIFSVVIEKAEKNSLEEAQVGALSISIDHLRHIIERRRAALAQSSGRDAELTASS